jgi:hypothetical protein
MPKKKLTKAQVKAKLKRINLDIYALVVDKLAYNSDSLVPMSLNKLLELHKALGRYGMKIAKSR